MGDPSSSAQQKYSDTAANARRLIDEEGFAFGIRHADNRPNVTNYVWDTATLAWVAMQQPVIHTAALAVALAGVASEATALDIKSVLDDLYTRTATDVDDDLIAKAQSLPLNIVENYLFSKTADAWIRAQCSSDGYAFVRINGAYTPNGDSILDDVANAMVSLLLGKTGDATYQTPRLDSATHSIQTIEYEHHEIHAGSHFEITNLVDLAINAVRDIRIVTQNTTKWAHLLFEVSVESETDVILYEGVTISAAGTGITPTNNDRNSLTASVMTVTYEDNASVANADTDTPTAGATVIYRTVLGAGKNAGADKEFILKQNTAYSLRFIANTAGYVNYNLEWYEHINKAA